jgi:hypothetical protein
LTVGGFGVPHEGHVCASGLPHSPQNLRSPSFGVPHEEQTTFSATSRLYSGPQELPTTGER